ncbi:DUF6270 domain-containing protein [Pseudarthrobacter sp. PH31-O2]|uniref:DUF6270 domain-containing protein n=1 Tax=Pseudarthrobacter sp. PH31-O2 TaxID=3046206 RepID=UPI0024BB285B|nr:DUF6270 domain-containing protein [Pseudarthrobacter sp. PH31-O2]MDJ0351346.1 DUF6270 domain-containing protein [Pseudarthrobacter sp. PH31-O2]
MEYELGAVRQYFDVAVPNNNFSYNHTQDKNAVMAAMGAAGIESVLPTLNAGRVLYLQNSTDWHVSKHLKPFLSTNSYVHRGNGFYSNDRGHSVVVSNFGSGHAVPPLQVIHYAIREMLTQTRSTRVIYNALIESGALLKEFYELPRDMQKDWQQAGHSVSLEIMRQKNDLTVTVNWGQIRPGTGGIKVSYSVFGADKRIQHSSLGSKSYDLKLDTPQDAVRVEATFVDGFDNRLGMVSISVEDFMKAAVVQSDASSSNEYRSQMTITAGTDESESARREQQATERPPLRIFVYGSCVSRDAFEESDTLKLVDYRARSSVGSAFGRRTGLFERITLANNPSAFQRRMVSSDLNKELAQTIRESSFDYLLVDFIDERLQLIRTGDRYDTYSPELTRAGLEVSAENLVEPGSTEYMEAFKRGWDKLLEIVPVEKIRLNRVFWASVDEDGKELEGMPKILEGNRLLQRLYSYALSFPGIQSIDYPDELIRSDSNHKWGRSPFHFSKAFYRKTIDALGAMSGESPGLDSSMGCDLSNTF